MAVLVALEDAFLKGRRIRRGEEFDYTGTRCPRWAARKGSARAKAIDVPVDPHIKPSTTREAAARRQEWIDAQALIAPGSRP